MDISAEINKTFGEEMAKLFVAKISDEELMATAQKVWNNLRKVDNNIYSVGGRREPEIERLIKEQILKRLYGKIEDILAEPVSEELLEKKAREMVESARKIGEEAIIKDIANNMVKNTLSVYGRDEKIAEEVFRRLNIGTNNRVY